MAPMLLCLLVLAPPPTMETADGLTVTPDGVALSRVMLDTQRLPVTVQVELRQPGTGRPLSQGFAVQGSWSGSRDSVRLDGEVRAAGESDQTAMLVIKVSGARLRLATLATDPLALPAKLLSRLPVVALTVGDQDVLALAVPTDKLALFEFGEREGGVELRYPFGFTREARDDLKMRAPFACELYRIDPRWRFRSALERYYRLHPQPFQRFGDRLGGWFFAAEPTAVPNPQHFAFYEGGPGGWDVAAARGMGTYPYRESSSATVGLSGKPPKSYDEAMQRFAELEQRRSPQDWQAQQTFAIDEQQRHGRQQSVLADSGETGAWAGVLQEVALDPAVPEPIVVSGWSRAEGVTGTKDHNYSIYVDAVLADGSYLFGQCAEFEPGTHDWQQATYTIRAAKPVARLRVFCLLRGHHGKAWFDDLRVGPLARPETNWLRNPGFEVLAPPRQVQYIKRHVVHNPDGRWAFWITDNLAADVGPAQPMNLLRFSLNVDPDLVGAPGEPTVAQTEFDYYDSIFRQTPELAGCYIDSVSAWCAGVANTRRDQWAAARVPFTYAGNPPKVASHGRFAMMKYLAALQARYHGQGKGVFTNIHVELASFPLYLVSDVPGIESSQFQDLDWLFFHRAAAGPAKPVPLLNFMNLHHLDRRAVAEVYHRNAAQFALFPSTGRFVAEAYQLYGDVTHDWLPTIQDLARAGWQPVPSAAGAWCERFGGQGAVWFTVRAASDTPVALAVEAAALRDLAGPLQAWDPVRLEPLTMERRDGGAVVRLPAGDTERVVRLSAAEGTRRWLRERARWHLRAAQQVRGQATADAELSAIEQGLGQADRAAARRLAERLAACQQRLPAGDADLFARSVRREVSDAARALRRLVEALPE